MKPSFSQRLARELVILLFFTLLALLMTWPLITKIGAVYAGNNEDLWTFQWDNWWTRLALQRGFDTLYTSYQFYPAGVSLAAHSLSFYNSLIWIPLSTLFGDIAAYNITILLTFILSGYTMFKLAEHLIRNWGSGIRDQATNSPLPTSQSLIPALLAGLIFAFAPYHLSQSLGHVSLASVQWFPLLALFALKIVREKSWRNIVAIGLLILLITATRLQFIVLGALTFAIFVPIDWLVLRREWVRGAIVRLIAGALLGLILCLPLILPAIRLYTSAATPDDLIADEQVWGQTDLLAYALPMTYHPIFGPIVQPVYEKFAKNQAWMPYLGYTALALAVWGILRVRPRRRSLPWIIVGLFLFVMALGPFPRINGVSYKKIHLPYSWIGDQFPLNTLRSPDRYNLLLAMALAPLAAFGAADILRRLNRNGRALKRVSGPSFVGCAIGALVLFEYLAVPYPTIDPLPASPFYAKLAADPEPYAVLDIPLERSDTKRYLYYQTLHDHPIVEGRVARVPPDAYALFDQIPLLSAWRTSLLAPHPADLGQQLQLLAQQNVRYIILHKDLAPPDAVTSLRNDFTLAPTYEDDQIAVYSTRPAIQPITPLNDNLGIVNSWADVAGPDKPIRVHVRWTATSPIGRDYGYRLSLVNDKGETLRELASDVITPTTSTWQTDTLVVGDYVLTGKAVPLGQFKLELSTTYADKPVSTLELPHRIINVPSRTGEWIMPVTEEPHARFGPAIELRAADVSRRGDLLSVWLHWHAITAPGVDTLYFVHLLDAAGNLVAQNDGIHVKYTRPSSGWQADDMISDLIELPLWQLKPGEYRIAVGLVDPDTSERLPAVDSTGQPLPDNRYIFSETITIDTNQTTN